MKTIRILALALLVLSIALVFAACGKKSSAPASTTPKTEAATTPGGSSAATTPGSSEQIATDGGVQTMPTTEEVTATPTVEITFNANGGAFTDGSTALTVTVEKNATLTAPASPTLDGFVFVGWSLDVGSADVWLFDTDTVSASVTLYAKWEQRTVERNVTFKLNYPSAADVIAPTTNGLITYIPARNDYAFNGWWISVGQLSNGEPLLAQKWDMNTVVTEDNLILYADWVDASTVSAQLSAPSVSINNSVFSWDAIEGASGYEIRVYKAGSTVEEMSETVTGTKWYFPNGYEAGYYTVKIRTKGNGMNNFNSSDTSRNYANRVLPNISSVDFNYSTSVLTWTSVANATAYELYIGGKLINTSSYTTYDLSDYEAGEYQITIKATRDDFTPSSVTKQIVKRKLKTPSVNCSLDKESLLYTITWNRVVNANVYKIDFGGTVIDVTDALSYSFGNSAPFWKGDTVSFTVSAFDDNTNFMISTPSEPITVKKFYTVTVTSNLPDAGTQKIAGDLFVPATYTVSFDLNGGMGSIPAQTVSSSNALSYPSVPQRDGYIFRGWYADASGYYDFSQTVTKDTVLRADWQAIGASDAVIDVTSGYNSSSSPYSISTAETTSSSRKYVFFTALTDGTLTLYYKNTSSSYSTYLYIYNATSAKIYKSNGTISNTSYTAVSITASAGDVIYVSAYAANANNPATCSFYVTDAKRPTAGGRGTDRYYMKGNGNETVTGGFAIAETGTEVALEATPTDGRYLFDGWYVGEEPVSRDNQYAVTVTKDATYSAKWYYYGVTTETNLSGAGSFTTFSDTPTEVGKSVTLTASTNNGYTWLGWYEGDEKLTDELSYTFAMPTESVSYTAKWTYYTVTTGTNDSSAGSYTAKSAQKTTAGQSVTLTASTNNGYTWLGWYDGDTKLTDNTSYTFTMPAESVTYTAKWACYTLTTNSNDSNAGSYTAKSAQKTTAGQSVTISASTNNGYTWLGWYNGDEQLTDELSYTFAMPAESVTYTAKWACYTLTTNSNDANAGSYTTKNAVKTGAGTSVTISASTRNGYTWLGWFNGDVKLTDELSYTFAMPAESVIYTAKWIVCPVTLERDLAEGGSVSGVSSATVAGKATTITATTNNGYTWLGWYNGDEQLTEELSYTFAMPTENVTFTAKWIVCPVTLERDLAEGGSVGGVSGATVAGKETTITATTNNGYTWLGWYNGDAKLTENTSYTFEMPTESVTYTAKWACYTLTTGTNDANAGSYTAKSAQKTAAGQSVTLTASTNNGYTWLGWYDGETKLTDELSYIFTMPTESVTYTAKWTYYTLSLNQTEGGTIAGTEMRPTVSFNLNGASGTVPDQTVSLSDPLVYPDVPTRSGYLFTGWYTDPACTKLFDFSSNLSGDLTLYAGWYSYSGSVMEINQYGPDNLLATSNSGTSSSNPKYIYFRALTTGTYTFGYKNGSSSSSYGTYLYIYDVTAGKVLKSNSQCYSTSVTTQALSLVAGHVYYARIYRYSTSYSTTFYTYIQGTKLPTAGGKAESLLNNNTTTKISAGRSVTLSAATENGYTWLGWYNGDAKLTENTSYTFEMPTESVTYTAKWACYTLTTGTNDANAGSYTAKSAQKTAAGQSVTLTASTNNGYTWLGWYDGETKLTDELSYTFAMPAESVTRTAKWIACPVTLERDLAEGGSVSGVSGATVAGKDTTITATTNNGYTWLGWYNGDVKLTDELSYTFAMPAESVTYTAKWFMAPTAISDNASAGSVSGMPSTTTKGQTVTVTATEPNLGYSFLGWYAGDTKLTGMYSYTFILTESSPSLVAKYQLRAEMNNFVFTSTTSTCTITGIQDKTVVSIIVPDYVTDVGESAFSGCSGITSVTIGSGVTSIGNEAFSACYHLVEVRNLSSLNITAGNTDCGYVGYYAKRIYKDGESYLHTTNDGFVFYDDGTDVCLVQYNGTEVDLTLPANFNGGNYAINQYTFYFCSVLNSVTIPNSVTSIGENAFRGCSGLTSITIPFVGATKDGTSNTHFGFIFGASSYRPTSTHNNSNCVPSSLKTVVITGETRIGDGAFYGCSGLTSVTIGNGVTSIGNYAFENCSELTSVTIGNGVTSIGERAFYNCSDLTSIIIPDSVTSIGESTFSRCSSLQSITIPFVGAHAGKTASDTYQYPFGYIFGSSSYTGGVATVQNYYGSSTSSVIYTYFYIPSSLQSVTVTGGNILYGAFYNCSNLTSVTIGNGVISIGNQAFYNCSGLQYNEYDNAHYLGNASNPYLVLIKAKDRSISSCTILEQTKFIYSYAFSDCSGLSSITVPDFVTSIGDYAFSRCSGLTSVKIGNGVTSIGEEAFSGCSGLTSVIIGSSVTNIGGDAFSGCKGLTSVTIPDSVTSIGNGAFQGCSKLTTVAIGNGVTSIGSYAFSSCSGLTSVTIPDSVTSIGSSAFADCSGLTSVTIGNGVTSIGSSAFSYCSKLTAVYITDLAAWCGISFGSSLLTDSGAKLYLNGVLPSGSFVIPNGITTIPAGTFRNCSSLTSITIPDSVTSIGEYAFYDCSGLTSVTIGNGVTSIGNYAFHSCSKLTTITIPDSVTSIGYRAFARCIGLTSITIPDSVTSIGSYAFYTCTGLTSITFTGTKAQWNAISKESNWNYNTGKYTVHCTDGDIAK